jgi:hypothetical protein
MTGERTILRGTTPETLTIGAEPGPGYMRPELISGGNTPKSNIAPLFG